MTSRPWPERNPAVISLRRRPPRRLLELAPVQKKNVVGTGAIGFLDAADEDRRRWIARFRSLLDGLDAPLQVIVRFSPGNGHRDPPPRLAAGRF